MFRCLWDRVDRISDGLDVVCERGKSQGYLEILTWVAKQMELPFKEQEQCIVSSSCMLMALFSLYGNQQILMTDWLILYGLSVTLIKLVIKLAVMAEIILHS